MRSTSDPRQRAAGRLWWYVWLSRIALSLAIGGVIAIGLGAACLPWPFVNPKAITSLFAVLGASGALLQFPRPLFEIGGLLVLCSVALKFAIRTIFRESHG